MQLKRHIDKSRRGSNPGKYDANYQHFYHSTSDAFHTRNNNLEFQVGQDTYARHYARE